MCSSDMKSIYVFDFDGTLTYKDTLLEFIKYSKGIFRFIFGFLLFSPLLVLMKLHLYDNGKAKQQLFAFYFQGMSLTTFDTLCHDFARDKHVLFRPQAFLYLQSIKKQADQILVISASIDNWVRPFFSTIFSAEGVRYKTRSARWKINRTFHHPQLLWTGEGEPIKTGIKRTTPSILNKSFWR